MSAMQKLEETMKLAIGAVKRQAQDDYWKSCELGSCAQTASAEFDREWEAVEQASDEIIKVLKEYREKRCMRCNSNNLLC